MADKTQSPPAESAPRAADTTELHIPQTMNLDSAPKADLPPEPTAADAAPEPFDPRKDQMAEIFANRAKAIQKELQQASDMDVAGRADANEDDTAALADARDAHSDAAPAAQPAQADAPAQQPVAPAAEPPVAAASQKTRLVVNGQELEVSQDDLVRMAQLGLGANQKFQEAARMRDEAIQLRTQQPQQNTQQPQAGPSPHNQAPPSGDVVSSDVARDLAKRLNYGSEEDQVQAIQELGNVMKNQMSGGQPMPAPQDLVNTAVKQTMETITFQQNLATIAQEFPDVFNSRALSIAAADEVAQLRQNYIQMGIVKPNLEIYREACSKMRNDFIAPKRDAAPVGDPQAIPPASSTQSVPAPAMQERLERKRAAPKPPAAASKVASDAPQKGALSPSQIVAAMRKSRHQPAY